MSKSKGPIYYSDGVPRCRWCEAEIDKADDLGMTTGYCSSKCYELSAGDDDE